jgi:HEPN domain-containing protein
MRSKEDYVRDWLAKAQSDLKVARREAAADDPATDAVCFHFQQAVEKMLKAWLAWRDQTPPRTHNIEVLLAACETLDAGFAELRDAEALTAFAVEIRYPDNLYFPTPQEVRETDETVQRVERFLEGCFRRGGFPFTS